MEKALEQTLLLSGHKPRLSMSIKHYYSNGLGVYEAINVGVY